MASSNDNLSMAVFCDFENVALGVRDANYEKFDIKPVLERLLLKGSIVVKKAYCDWERYKGFKATMHEANFELIEIPHVRQSGKNSADIRLVVDALDLCYTKSHVNTFVIISGDSDFSPLVSKLRENAKQVIGVGVKQSTSDLLVANCDEFIFYDDLVRESRRAAAKRDPRVAQPSPKRTPDEEKSRKDDLESRRSKAVEMAVETFDALVSERGDGGKIWASMLKEAIKRRKPDFSESYYGFRTFGNLLEEAQARGLLEFGRDEKSGAYVYRSSAPVSARDAVLEHVAPESGSSALPVEAAAEQDAHEQQGGKHESRRKGRGGRKPSERQAGRPVTQPMEPAREADLPLELAAPVPEAAVWEEAPEIVAPVEQKPGRGRRPRQEAGEQQLGKHESRRNGRGAGGQSERHASRSVEPVAEVVEVAAAPIEVATPVPEPVLETAAPAQENPARGRRPRAGARQQDDKASEAAPARRRGAKSGEAAVIVVEQAAPEMVVIPEPAPDNVAQAEVKPARKPAARGRRPRKTDTPDAA